MPKRHRGWPARGLGAVVAVGIVGWWWTVPPLRALDDRPDQEAPSEADTARSDGQTNPPASENPVPLAYYYGFRGAELYKLENGIRNLLAHDLNGDGRTDLVVFNNRRSRIDVLLQRASKPEDPLVVTSLDRVNRVESDWRFEHVPVSVNKKISCLAVGDFNADGRADLAYAAPPDELVVHWQDADAAKWNEHRRFQVSDLSPAPWSLDAGDLNGDGHADLVLLGTESTYVFYQKEGALQDPVRLFNTTGKLGLVRVADLDGDGRNDIVYMSGESEDRPLRARLQGRDGQLGPEISFELPGVRALSLGELDGQPGAEVLVIENTSGRAKVYTLAEPDLADPTSVNQLITYGFGSGSSGRNRALALGDVDGDDRIDVLVTDPEGSQVILYRQQEDGDLGSGETFPCLSGANWIGCSDLDGDGAEEVVVASTSEKAIGVSRLEEGRLTFPTLLPSVDVPVAFDLADTDGDGTVEIVYVSRSREAGRSEHVLRALKRHSQDQWEESKFGTRTTVPLPRFRTDPEALLALEANGDNKPDYLVLSGRSSETPVLLLSEDSGNLAVASAESSAGLGGAVAGGVFISRQGPKSLLIAQKNFARQATLGADGRWQIVDQFNAPERSARVAGVAVLELDGQPGSEVVVLDAAGNKLYFLRQQEGVYRPWRELQIGPLSYKGMFVADLNGDQKDDLLLFGADKFGVVYTGRPDHRLKELASYETPLEDARLTDLVSGDLNHDGQPDIALIDTATQYLHIAAFRLPGELQHAVHFKVFEAKGIVRAGATGMEPREIVIADVTSDGLPDVVFVVHDRILVYPQDDGSPKETVVHHADENPKEGDSE